MSLDISLYSKNAQGNESEVWGGNITHNLNDMARKAGLYEVMWRPDQNGVEIGMDAIDTLVSGMKYMILNKKELENFNQENGWGTYEELYTIASEYLLYCWKYPNARIEVSR